MINIGFELKKYRNEKKVSQSKMANMLGVSHATISRWEKGLIVPNKSHLKIIGEIINIDFHNNTKKNNFIEINDGEIVAFQGERGAYSEQASKNIFPNCEVMACHTFEDVFNLVNSGEIKYGVIPIENSLGGRVTDIHKLIPLYDLKIIDEHYLKIEHCLLGYPGSRIDDIRSVYSHEQALMQCSKNIRDLGIEKHSYIDTAGAANFVMKNKDMHKAAIASKKAADVYGLSILKNNFQDQDNNFTRFIVLSKEEFKVDSSVSRCKTSCFFTTKSIPSSLYKSLGGFATWGINLLKIESYLPMDIENPVNNDASFYIEFEGNAQEDIEVKNAIEELKFFSKDVKILGSYYAK